MGGKFDRTSLVASMDGALKLQAMLVRNMSGAIRDEFGAEGDRCVEVGLSKYGAWRGEQMQKANDAAGFPRDARTLIAQWPTADVLLVIGLRRGRAAGGPARCELTIEDTPEWSYWLTHDCVDLAHRYYAFVYGGIAAGYDSAAAVELAADLDLETPWTTTWRFRGSPEEPNEPISTGVFDDVEAMVSVVRRTVQNYSALYVFLAREAIRRFDAAGENAVREGIRRQGRERGEAQRQRHLAQGTPINLKSLMEDFDVPVAAAWEWKDDGYLTAGTWQQDCTWCPHIPVWKELNALDLGYIYDFEIHHSHFRAYHPGMRIQWETLQTRGSATCAFRFSIPELQAAGEPGFEGRKD